MSATQSSFKKRLETRIRLLQMLADGLDGKPFAWGSGESKNYFPIARDLGVTLKTKTAIERSGMVLKRNAKSVGSAYYGAPIQSYCELYIVEVHTQDKIYVEA